LEWTDQLNAPDLWIEATHGLFWAHAGGLPLRQDQDGSVVRSSLRPYADVYRESIAHPEDFWMRAADAIDWYTKPTIALDNSDPDAWRWFPDGVLNTAYNALDRHVLAGHGDRAALIYDSGMTGARHIYTYAELLENVANFGGALAALGVRAGDRVIIYLPLIPEAVVAMLAVARLGAIHSVVFGGYAAAELAARIDDARPSVLLTSTCGLEPGRKIEYLPIIVRALAMSATPPKTVVVKRREYIADATRLSDGWLDWDELVASARPVAAVPVRATDPLYILYTSGTAGKPKGVVRDNGGHAVALAWSMPNIYGVDAAEVMWAASDVGWAVGHTYIAYARLLAGATAVLYEGKPVGTPDAGTFWRIIRDYRVKALLCAPTAIRAIRQADPQASLLANYDVSSLDTLFLAGERLDPGTYGWAAEKLGKPVIDHWWQTETGWPACANLRGVKPLPVKIGSPSVPVPGYEFKILDVNGDQLPASTEGNIVIKLPLPPGSLLGLWNDSERFRRSYLETFPGYYLTGDAGYVDEDGYLYVLGRTDDVINVAGHRLTTGEMESVVASHPAVIESAVIAVHDDLKGQRPSAYVVLNGESLADQDAVRRELIALVRDQIGPIASFRDVTIVDALPKSRSDKILRRTLRQIAEGEDYETPPTIEDPSVLKSIADATFRDRPV